MNDYKKSIFNKFDCDLWTHLSKSNKPILIYGMGNGADKIISVFEKYGIEYKDVFASDGFVRGHSYKGKRVLSYSEAIEAYGNDIIIVLSFGSSLPDVMQRMYELDKKHEFYSPDVPVCPGELFNEDFFDENIFSLLKARELFHDERSKEIFDDIIRYKLSGRLEYLKSTECSENETFDILSLSRYTSYLDLGEYNGDTVRKFLNTCPNLKNIYAFEPDLRNFKKLSLYAEGETRADIKAFNFAAWDANEALTFSSSGNRNSSNAATASHQTKYININARRADDIIKNVDFIKYDVEGSEYKAIAGSKKIIENSSPDMLISMYHRSEDMYELPILINSLNSEYKLYLRRLPYIPAWDLNLYAIK